MSPTRAGLALLVVLACTGRDDPRTSRRVGDESFVSPAPGGVGGPLAPTPGGSAGAADGAVPAKGGAGEAAPREISEPDLYARAGSLLLVLNAWRGLQTVDLSDLGRPQLRGRVPLTGVPVGLHLRGTVALVASSDHLSWITDAASGTVRSSQGSRIWAVDVANPDAPEVLAEVPVAGAIQDTRLVGDVLYVVTGTWQQWYLAAGEAPASAAAGLVDVAEDALLVASLDVSDPRAPRVVDRVEIEAGGWSVHAHVTADRITVARAGWDPSGEVTRLSAIDISDPAGDLVAGAELSVPGQVRDRWGLDLDPASGTFRVVVQQGWNGGARLHVLDWSSPSAATLRAELAIDVPETVTAARFDGARAYVVTALAVDPLWVVDLADPGAPRLAGHLEMPGQLDFIEPRGARLLALGHTNEAGGVFQLQVSLLDVADPAAPKLVARRVFGPDWGFVPASADDLRKVFQVLDGEGLVLVPFEGFDRSTSRWVGGTQLLTLAGDALELAGFVPGTGAVKRAFSAGVAGRLAAFSDERLQTIDASDAAHPVELGSLELARSVVGIAIVGDVAAELSGEAWRDDLELVVVPADDPDSPSPVARVPLSGSFGRLFRVGDVVWALAHDSWSMSASVRAVDLSDPGSPRPRGRLELAVSDVAHAAWAWYGRGAAQVGSRLVLLGESWGCAATCDLAGELLVVDLSDPDAPRLTSRIPLPARVWTSGLAAVGTTVWYSWCEWWDRDASTVRYHVGRLDLADPEAPRVLDGVNVPGWFFSASDDGARVYTLEPASGDGPWRTQLHALALTDHGTARLVGTVELDGSVPGAVRAGDHAYAVGWRSAPPGAFLAAVSLAEMRLASAADLDALSAGIAAAAGGRLFVARPWPEPAMLVYDLAEPGAPRFVRSASTSGWTYEVVVEGHTAYLPSGRYGVVTIDLAP